MSRLNALPWRPSPASMVMLVCIVTAVLLGVEDFAQIRAATSEEHRYQAREIQEGLGSLHRDLQMVTHLASRTDAKAMADTADYIAARRDQMAPVRWLGLLTETGRRPQILLGAADIRGYDPAHDPAVAPLLSASHEGMLAAVAPGTYRDRASLAIVVGPVAAGAPTLVALIDADDLLDDSLKALSHAHAPHLDLKLSGATIAHWPQFPPNHTHLAGSARDSRAISVATLDFTISYLDPDPTPALLRLLPQTLGLLIGGLAMAVLVRRRTATPSVQPPPPPIPSPPDERAPIDPAELHRARLWQLGELAATLAHDLGQPLNVIRLTAESAQDALSRGQLDNARAERALGNAVGQTLRAQAMIDALVASARRPSAPPVALHPVESVRRALAGILPRLRAQRVRLVWHADLTAPLLHGHPARLEASIRHLLVNALEALAGRPNDQAAGTLAVDCRGGDGGVVITVADDGPGFPEDLRLWLENPLSAGISRGKGCGLGLTVALGVAAEMGGTLMVANTDPGTRVTLTLPPPHRSVLLVEDDYGAATEISDFLSGRGWAVRHADGGNAALELFHHHGADAVITDLHMTGGDGWHLIEQLSACAPDLPIIAVSTVNDEDARRAVAGGAALVLRKPIGVAELCRELEELVDENY